MVMSSNNVRAMILAAGEGTRLRPLTIETPKALLPVGGVPLIRHTIGWLAGFGISEIAINLYHLGENIRSYLGGGSRLGVNIYYSSEKTLLGTAGGVKKIEEYFSETFVVVYGDVFTNFNLGAMLSFHRSKSSLATIAVLRVPNPWEVGVVEVSKESRILNFIEKPPRNTETSNLGSGGIYVMEKEILNHIPPDGYCDFAYDIFPRLLKLDLPLYGYVLNSEDYLIDIGTAEKYQRANEDVKSGRVKVISAE